MNLKVKKRHLFLTVVIFAIVCFFINGCKIDPKIHDEFYRSDMNSDIRSEFLEFQNIIPDIMKKRKVPGAALAVVDTNGIIWSAAFGYTDYDKKTPITPDTVFSIQSMSKTFTATAVMRAVQDGLVDMDTPISQYIPGFKINSRYEHRPEDVMTIRHLLTHTAGFVHEAPIGNNINAACPSFESHVKSISDTWLRCKVGESWNYSNLGIDLAAYILQVESNKLISEYMQGKIFGPLGMVNSSVDLDVIRNHPNRAIGHRKHFKELELIPMLGAGGVYTSANDLAKFIQLFLNDGRINGQTILDNSSLEIMYAPLTINNNFGTGVYIVKSNNGHIYINHGGGGFGFSTFMIWYPEYGIGGLVLANSESGLQLFNIIEELIKKELIQKKLDFILPDYWDPKVDNVVLPVNEQPEPAGFTRYKPQWEQYTGNYEYILGGNKLHTYAAIALAMGYPVSELEIKIYEKNGFLEINGERLEEYKPGVFFTNSGQCLDFTGDFPLWNGVKIKKR